MLFPATCLRSRQCHANVLSHQRFLRLREHGRSSGVQLTGSVRALAGQADASKRNCDLVTFESGFVVKSISEVERSMSPFPGRGSTFWTREIPARLSGVSFLVWVHMTVGVPWPLMATTNSCCHAFVTSQGRWWQISVAGRLSTTAKSISHGDDSKWKYKHERAEFVYRRGDHNPALPLKTK